MAARRLHAHDLRRDGAHPHAAPPGTVRPAPQVMARALGLALVVAAVLAFPLSVGPYPVKLVQEILIWGIFAMSLDLLMGYAGMVSFGHSAFLDRKSTRLNSSH